MVKKTRASLYSIDTFLETIKGMPKYRNISDVTLAGFYNKMKNQDKLYVFDPQDYVKALESYIND